MKIGVDISCFRHRGIGIVKSLKQLVGSCKNIYPDIEFVFFSNRFFLKTDFNFSNRKLFFLKTKIKIFANYADKKLNDCDLLLFANNGENLFLFSNKRKVAIIHDVLPLEIPNYFKNEKERNLYIKKTQKIIDNASIIFTPSEYSKQQIKNKFKCDKKIIVLPWGITMFNKCAIENPQLQYTKGKYFIFDGGYDRRKGLYQLVKAMIKASEKSHFNTKLIITGMPRYFSEEFKQAVEQAVSKNILIQTGHIDNNCLGELIKNAEALFYPSRYEGFGMPILEGMKLGCPVIVSHGTCIEEIAKDAAIYINIDGIDEVANFLLSFDKESNEVKELISKGNSIAQEYSWEKTAKQFIETIKETFDLS